MDHQQAPASQESGSQENSPVDAIAAVMFVVLFVLVAVFWVSQQ